MHTNQIFLNIPNQGYVRLGVGGEVYLILILLIIRFVTSTQRKVRFEVPLGELWAVDDLSAEIQGCFKLLE